MAHREGSARESPRGARSRQRSTRACSLGGPRAGPAAGDPSGGSRDAVEDRRDLGHHSDLLAFRAVGLEHDVHVADALVGVGPKLRGGVVRGTEEKTGAELQEYGAFSMR